MVTTAPREAGFPHSWSSPSVQEREQTHRRNGREDGLDQRLGGKLRVLEVVVLPSGLELRRGGGGPQPDSERLGWVEKRKAFWGGGGSSLSRDRTEMGRGYSILVNARTCFAFFIAVAHHLG